MENFNSWNPLTELLLVENQNHRLHEMQSLGS